MSLIKWNPFRKMEDFFENYPTELRGGKGEATRAFESWSPIVDISETDKEFLIQAELPGVEKKDINLTIEQGVLTLNGERRFEHKKDDKKHHPIESIYGSFTRSFKLPEAVNEQQIEADFKNNILIVKLMKSEVPKIQPVKIDIH